MDDNKKQHVQLEVTATRLLKPFDWLVLANIKRYMNKDTQTCFPSISVIAEHCDRSTRSVIRSIKKLEAAGQLKAIRTKGKPTMYSFKDVTSSFEMYSFEFLDHPDLTTNEKAFLIGLQFCSVKNRDGYMGTTYPYETIATTINLSKPKVLEVVDSLRAKGILSELPCKSREESGLKKTVKAVDLQLIGQAVLYLKDQVQQNTEDIELIKRQLNEVIDYNKSLLEERRELKEQLRRQELNSQVSYDTENPRKELSFPF